MTTTSTVSSTTSTAAASTTPSNGYASLDMGDFLELMTAQMQMQDPLDPVDNNEMLAQMAQFSTLSATTESNDTLSQISSKLDTIIASQALAASMTPATANNTTA